MAVVWPQVLDYLVTTLKTAAGLQVYKGAKDTDDDPLDYATVGHIDGEDSGGTFQQDHVEDYFYTETGTVRLSITCQTGDSILDDVQVRLFGYLDMLDSALRHDQSLGGVLTTGSALLAAEAVQPVKTSDGYAMTAICTVTYTSQSLFPG